MSAHHSNPLADTRPDAEDLWSCVRGSLLLVGHCVGWPPGMGKILGTPWNIRRKLTILGARRKIDAQGLHAIMALKVTAFILDSPPGFPSCGVRAIHSAAHI